MGDKTLIVSFQKELYLLTLLAGVVYCIPCPTHAEFEPSHKYCIWLGEAAGYFTADAECRSWGGYLLILDHTLYEYLLYNSTLASQLNVDVFVWIDGIDFDTPGSFYDRHRNVIQVPVWRTGQPDTSTPDMNCLKLDIVDGVFVYNDLCSKLYKPLCYIDIGNNSLCPNSQQTVVYYPPLSLCFWPVATSGLFSNAPQLCIQTGDTQSTLAKIENAHVNDFLHQHMLKILSNFTQVWIGFDDIVTDGDFRWQDGTSVTYINIAESYPYTTRDCGALKISDFTWTENSCYVSMYESLCYRNINTTVLSPIGARYPPTDPSTSQTTTHLVTTDSTTTDHHVTTVPDLTTTSLQLTTQHETTVMDTTAPSAFITTGLTTPEETSTHLLTLTQTVPPAVSLPSTADACFCPCNMTATVFTEEQLKQRLKELHDILTLDKKDTASYKRTKISAYDGRVSSQSIGFVGVAILVIITSSIVFIDIPTLYIQLKQCSAKRQHIKRVRTI